MDARLLAGRGRSGARAGAGVGDGEAERGQRDGGEGDEAGRGQELHGSPPWVAYPVGSGILNDSGQEGPMTVAVTGASGHPRFMLPLLYPLSYGGRDNGG